MKEMSKVNPDSDCSTQSKEHRRHQRIIPLSIIIISDKLYTVGDEVVGDFVLYGQQHIVT